MAEALPQLDPAADADDGIESPDSVARSAADRAAAAPGGPPRAKTPEDIIKGLQSENDRVKSKFGRLLTSEYAKRYGGDGILQALEQLEAIIAHPETAKSVTEHLRKRPDGAWEYRPPALARAAQVDADAGLGGGGDAFADDPLVKVVETRIDAKLAKLEERMNAFAQRSESALTAGSEQKLSDMMRRFKANYPVSPEETPEFAEAVRDRIARLDPQVLLRMTDEQFEEYVGLPSVKKFLPSIFARKAKQRGTVLAGFATDASGTPSLGAEAAPNGKARPGETWGQLQKRLAALAEQAAREPA